MVRVTPDAIVSLFNQRLDTMPRWRLEYYAVCYGQQLEREGYDSYILTDRHKRRVAEGMSSCGGNMYKRRIANLRG